MNKDRIHEAIRRLADKICLIADKISLRGIVSTIQLEGRNKEKVVDQPITDVAWPRREGANEPPACDTSKVQ